MSGDQFECASLVVKKTLEEMDEKTDVTEDKIPSSICLLNFVTIQRTLADFVECLLVNFAQMLCSLYAVIGDQVESVAGPSRRR